VVNLAASANRRGDGSRIPEVTVDMLDVQPIKSGVITSAPDKSANAMPIIQQTPDKICAEMTACARD
jgi:hypothetical protein